MKRLIEFDKESYTKEINKLNNLVTGINKAIEIIVQFEPITFDEIKKLCTKSDYIEKERYEQKLQELAKLFSIRYENLNDKENSHIRQMARSSIQFLKDAKKIIGIISLTDEYLLSNEYIIFEESTVKVAPNAEEKIRAKNTYYTKNKKESKLLEKLNSVIGLLNEIETEFGGNNGGYSYYYNPTVNSLYYFNIKENKFKIRRNNFLYIASKTR